MPRERGRIGREAFTLIEVIVALALLAMVAALTAPSLAKGVNRARFNAAARELVSALRSTRRAAILGGKEDAFVFDVTANQYSIDGRRRGLSVPKGTTVALITAQSEGLDDSSGRIRFFADGSSTGGTVTLSYRGRHLAVEVDWLTGHVTLGT